MAKPVFLSAKWRHLALLNFEIDPQVLQPHLPFGVDLDFYQGKTYVSLVGFMFYQTKVFGFMPAPFHRTFEEVNLRFYVVRKEDDQFKRGVVFVKEIVPKPLLAWIARRFYQENYVAMKMDSILQQGSHYEYRWGESHFLKIKTRNKILSAEKDSFERWITEHYWGYTKANSRTSYEYEVKHPVWNLYQVENYEFQVDTATLYGSEFVPALSAKPCSVFLADGSEVSVHFPVSIRKDSIA